jgi:hypothetical protein
MKSTNQLSGPRQLRITGILCDIELNEQEFVDVLIADGQELLPEWIVRGAITLESAKGIAEQAIAARKDSYSLIHDVEGRILVYKIQRPDENNY